MAAFRVIMFLEGINELVQDAVEKTGEFGIFMRPFRTKIRGVI